MISDMKKYLDGNRDHVTTQAIIGFNILFRGHIVKYCHRNNEECESHHELNRVIVKKAWNFTPNARTIEILS